MRTEPYRVVVWGPGVLGQALLRDIIDKPEFELVGVLAYNPDKDGVDAGELAGRPAVGVAATTDQAVIFGLDPDVVFMCPQTTAPVDVDSAVTAATCRWLEAGVNVVSAPAYHWPHMHPGLTERLEAACATGGSTLHSTGINPGLLNERWMLAFTAVCTKISRIVVQEINDNSTIDSADMMGAIGYGQDPVGNDNPIVMALGARYYSETLFASCHALGVEVDPEIAMDFEWIIADKDYQHAAIAVAKGTINGIIHRYTATIAGEPFMTLEEIFYGGPDAAPVPVTGGDNWTIMIEGEPASLKLHLDMKSSILRDERFAPGDLTLPAYYATSVPMLQAVPLVVDAAPGILWPSVFSSYKPDLRQLSRRARAM
jgi:2,4-diaminopentanoate dehydrogenase